MTASQGVAGLPLGLYLAIKNYINLIYPLQLPPNHTHICLPEHPARARLHTSAERLTLVCTCLEGCQLGLYFASTVYNTL
jgi:hypothetical protein